MKFASGSWQKAQMQFENTFKIAGNHYFNPNNS